MKLPKEHLSYSQLVLYDRCPKCYRMKYVDEIPALPTDALVWGKRLHEIIFKVNRYILSLKNKLEMDPDKVREIYDAEFVKDKFSFLSYRRGWECLLDYAETTFKASADIFKTEYEIACELTDSTTGKAVKLLGVIDRIDTVDDGRGLEIIDFKSGGLLPAKDEVDNNLQLSMYAYLMSKRFPEYKIYTSLWAIGAMKKTKVEKDLSRLADIEDYVIGLWKQMLDDKTYKAKLNNFCVYCPKQCPLYKKMLTQAFSTREPKSNSELVDMYKKVNTNLALIKKEKDALAGRIKAIINTAMGESFVVGEDEFLLVNRHRDPYTVAAVDYQELRYKKVYNNDAEKEENGKKERKNG